MDGLLIIDKPAGLTSHDVVARARRILKEKRIGHTGTLDPFATGVLVLLVGRVTRLAQFLSTAEKEYEATIRFGYATDTGDSTGQHIDATGQPKVESEILKAADESLSAEREASTHAAQSLRVWTPDEIEAALAPLRGPRLQVPPMYSAKKVDGRKLYELARRGVRIERTAVPVIIHQLETLSGPGGELLRARLDHTVEMDVRVVCSAGTYIRVLAEEIAERLGTGAHLSSLRRTRAGQFTLTQALRLDELQERDASCILLEPGAALSFMPFVHLTTAEARRAKQGARLRPVEAEAAAFDDGAHLRLLDENGSLIAVGVYEAATGMVHPRIVVGA